MLTSDDRFLTFNSGSGSQQQQQLLRRQSSSDQPLVYNASQTFPTIAGDTYNVTAYAQQAQNGANPPQCSISICVYNSCSAPASLVTGVWQQYYYLYLATFDDDAATATFSITCVGDAYVGLDNVAIIDIPPPDSSTSASPMDGSNSGSSAPSGSSVSLTTLPGGSVRTVTRTIVRTRTTSAIVSTAVYYTTTQVSYIVSTYESDNTYTTYQPTTFVSTAYATATSLQNVTVSAIVTSTSKCIRFLYLIHEISNFSKYPTSSEEMTLGFLHVAQGLSWSQDARRTIFFKERFCPIAFCSRKSLERYI